MDFALKTNKNLQQRSLLSFTPAYSKDLSTYPLLITTANAKKISNSYTKKSQKTNTTRELQLEQLRSLTRARIQRGTVGEELDTVARLQKSALSPIRIPRSQRLASDIYALNEAVLGVFTRYEQRKSQRQGSYEFNKQWPPVKASQKCENIDRLAFSLNLHMGSDSDLI
ncbi:hypothetical protein SS50377_27819 [Spironucleus salmonicida]|uniref:Uncharacterized protein n=1 Tax=Spironucleus salmonicida TaxID=348837 RepID=A0A9P8LKX8_9EUKA|nr:hypothetical protein SS50377_27819 [Spironucleus salmonicida]